MKTTSRIPRWLWGSVVGIGLIAVSVALFYLLNLNSSVAPPSQEINFSIETNPEDSTVQTSIAEPVVAIDTDSTPKLRLPIRSVEEACGIHEFPAYKDDSEESNKEALLKRAFESEECKEALAAHVGAMNPYLWGRSSVHLRQFAFVMIENPLTFDRIFTDPSGDFARVQFTLSRPECLLENGTATDYELKESCNAEALLNYALLNEYCFYGTRRNRVYHTKDPTPEDARLMWKQELESLWIRTKCKEFDSDLKLTEDKHPDLSKLLSTLANSNSLSLHLFKLTRKRLLGEPLPEILPRRFLISTLIEMAARLGDDAAGLTNAGPLTEDGLSLGRFQELESNLTWQELRWKREPSQDRLLQTFKFLPTLASMDIEFDWEWLVRHLCEPPYPYGEQGGPLTPGGYAKRQEASSDPRSCRAVINDMYIDGNLSDSVLEVIAQFERTAMELDLYH